MTAYAFNTITPQQALAIQAGDTLTFAGGPANRVSVAYDPDGVPVLPARVYVTFEGRTVTFGTGLTELAKAGGLVMADGSQLYIGDGGNDRFNGAASDDAAYGGVGADSLNGGAGADLIQGNSGDDELVGGEGADTLYGGQGDDVIYTSREVGGVAGERGDFAQGNLGNDEIFGGAGNDTLLGGQGRDFLGGSDGNDYLSGDLGEDELNGGLGNDTLQGGFGDDILSSGFGADLLNGGDGNDRLVSQGPEASTLNGGAGDDTLTAAGAGRDILYGDTGQDRFEFVAKTAPSLGVEAEIRDWEMHDKLHFDAVSVLSAPASILPRSYSEFVADNYATALSIANENISATGAVYVAAQVGGNVYVFADTGDPTDGADIAVLLVGRNLADISLWNFS